MKKLILFLLTLVFLPSIAIAEVRQATVINPDTNHRKVVNIGDPSAFDDGYLLEVSYGYVEQKDDMLGFSVASSYSTTLSSSMTSTQATTPVSSVTTKIGDTLTMAQLGSKVFLTLEPGGSKEEIVMCTGLSGTSWTGCTRGLSSVGTSTVTVAARRKTHSAGSIIIMSNVHYVYDEQVDKDSDETIAGDKTFSGDTAMTGNLVVTGGTASFANAVVVASSTTPTLDTHLATKKYVDDTAVAGAPDATETVKGNVELATKAEMALGTATGGTGASLVLKSEYATSSPDVATTSVVISKTNGNIDQGWLDLTEDFTFSGDTTLASTTISGTTTITKLPIATTDITPWDDKQLIPKSYADGISSLYQAGADLLTSTDAGTNTDVVTYVKMRDTNIDRKGGTLTVKFTLNSVSGAVTAYGRIYVNDIAVGTERIDSTGSPVEFSEDITINAGDNIQIYAKTGTNGENITITNFRIYQLIEFTVVL